MHAITETHDPKQLAEHTLTTAATYLACGVDVERSTLFVQSHVAAHPHMARLLGAVATFGMLKRMIQFQEKSGEQGDASLGLLDYPVLMAADILLYKPHVVPVGEDQLQHLRLARDLAARFNSRFGAALKLPEPLMATAGARVMSLNDGRRKMSKSDPNDASRINLLDGPDVIRAKIKKAKSDSIRGVELGNPERPEANNLLVLYALLSGKSTEVVAEETAQMGFGDLKRQLTDAAIAYLEPIQSRFHDLMNDRATLLVTLKRGAQKASVVAEQTLLEARESMGFLLP